MPNVYRNLPEGEKVVLKAFFFKEMEERKEKNEMMNEAAKKGFFCPSMFS